MKRIIFLISLSLLAVCCSKEANYNEISDNDGQAVETPSVGTKTVTFTATVENDPVTEGSVATNGAFTWSNTDEIAVWTSSQKRTATATNISGSSADFTFTLEESETISSGAIVVYPESLLTAAGTVTFPTTYTADEAAKSNLALAAEVNGSSLSFKYLGAVIEATITDVPSIATAIEVTSTEVLTGVHTVSFSEGIPSMATSSTAKTITVTPVAGPNTIVLPLPTVADGQKISYSVKYSSNVLFTRTATKNVVRSAYFKMKDLTIAPIVYLKSSMTDWTEENSGAVMSRDGSTYSISLNSIGNQYATVYVKYPALAGVIKMGPSEDQSTTSSQAFVPGNSTAIKMTALGGYYFTFNPTTSNFTFSKVSDDVPFYLTLASESWAYSNTAEFEKVGSGYCLVTSFSGNAKIYYNEYPASRLTANTTGSSGDLTTEKDQYIHVDDSNSYLIVFSLASNKFYVQYLTGTGLVSTAACDNVYFKTLTNPGGYLMTNCTSNNRVWYYDWTVPNYNSCNGDALSFWVDYKDGQGGDFELKPANATVHTYGSPTYCNRDDKTDQWWFTKDQVIRVYVNDTNSNVIFLNLS